LEILARPDEAHSELFVFLTLAEELTPPASEPYDCQGVIYIGRWRQRGIMCLGGLAHPEAARRLLASAEAERTILASQVWDAQRTGSLRSLNMVAVGWRCACGRTSSASGCPAAPGCGWSSTRPVGW
jgi:hypothetical protein